VGWGLESSYGRRGPIKKDLEVGGPSRLVPVPLLQSLTHGPEKNNGRTHTDADAVGAHRKANQNLGWGWGARGQKRPRGPFAGQHWIRWRRS
jgi:hypothetical protein